MILVETVINGTTYYLSNEQLYLTHQWDAFINSVSPIHYSLPSDAGGFFKPRFGTIKFSTELFESEWPPPDSITITIKLTDTTEAAATTIFEGKGFLVKPTQKYIEYELSDTGYSSTLTADTIIDDDLEGVLTTYCGASYLNLSTDYTNGRATSPAVYAKFDTGTSVINMLSDICEAHNHLFYIVGGTLYLVDMLLTNGTDIELTEFDFEPVDYENQQPFKRFYSQGINLYSVAGSVSSGDTFANECAQSIEHFYMKIGDNSGDDMRWLIHKDPIEFDSSAIYRIEVRARLSAGSGTAYFGLTGVASDRETLVNTAGADSHTSQHYHAGTALSLSSDFAIYTGYTSDHGATVGEGTAHPLISNPGEMHPDVAFIRPMIICNYNAVAGRTDIDYIAIHRVDGSDNIIETVFYFDFAKTSGHGQGWLSYTTSRGNMTVKTSMDESETNVEAALTNLKTIMESKRGLVSLPQITTSNLPLPGQKLSWSDESTPPGTGLSLTAYIKARDLVIDIDNDKIKVEGEGDYS